jgi:organic hydroperoxide reductase OsmC/OhrA
MPHDDRGDFAFTLTGDGGYRFTVDFDQEGVAPLLLDEPEPLGDGAGPNAARLLAAAVANCLSASLVFCLRKSRVEPGTVRTRVEGELVRNADGRMRIGGLKVRIDPDVPSAELGRLERCRELFEDFCLVTASVREGIDVEVEVAGTPVASAVAPAPR